MTNDALFGYGGLVDTIRELVAVACYGVYMCSIHYNSENSDHRQVLNRFVPQTSNRKVVDDKTILDIAHIRTALNSFEDTDEVVWKGLDIAFNANK